MASFGGTEACVFLSPSRIKDPQKHRYVELLITKCGERYSTATEAFRYVDESNNGFITPADFVVVFQRLLAVTLKADEAAALVAHFAGRDGADRVSFDEFARAYDRSGAPRSPRAAAEPEAPPPLAAVERLDAAFGAALDARADSIRAGFLNLDTHRTGFISYDELAEGLNRFGIPATPAETRALCALYDVRGDHRISYAEFVRRAVRRERPYDAHLLRQQDDLAAKNAPAPIGTFAAP